MWGMLLGADLVKLWVQVLFDSAQELFGMEGPRLLGLETWLSLVCHSCYQVSNDVVGEATLVVLRLHKDLITSHISAI